VEIGLTQIPTLDAVQPANHFRGSKSAAQGGHFRTLTTSKEHAQDGRGIKRPAERAGVFLSSLAARIRALCASKEHAQDGRGIKRPAERASVFLSSLAARIRALCASKESPGNALRGGSAISCQC